MCETSTVPAYSETYVKTYSCQNSSHNVSLLQPTNRYIDQGLLIAKTLLDTSQDQMVISVLNVSDRNIKLKQNAALGIAQPVGHVLARGQERTVSTGKQMIDCKLPEYLQPLVDGASASLTQSEKEKLSTLIGEFSDIFMPPSGTLGCTNLAEHYIDTGDTKPFKMPCHRIPMFKGPIIEQEIKKMLEQDVIEPSASPWSSPICLVSKKSGDWRFCVDLRALNSVTKLDTYPLPRIDETFDRLAGARYFSTLDMASGYWQLSLREEDRPKTSFVINGIGTYMFNVMCFGLKNTPASFSRLMEIVLRGLQYDKCLVYLDDIIVIGENFDKAMENLRSVFLRLRQANLQLKVSKCKLFQTKVILDI